MRFIVKLRSESNLLIFGSLTVWMIGVFHSLVDSGINNYHFYISEALVFNFVWLLFAPGFYFQKRLHTSLSKRMPEPLRSLTSALAVMLAHWFGFAFLIWSISGLFFSYTFAFDRMLLDGISDHGIIYILVYTLFGFLIRITGQKKEIKLVASNSKLKVNSGTKTILIDQKEILYIKAEKPYIAIHTHSKTYLDPSTLKAMIAKLDSGFIRIHKSTIVNTRFVTSFRSRQNGDYDIYLCDGSELRLSRNYAAGFRQAFTSLSLA
ncbi:MAG: LytR/AlgR family response regulator transcription factor [Owenweeksia sp.]